jgi:hypothetical protein
MNIIPIPPPIEIPEVQRIAISELSFVNASLARRVDEHKMRFVAFWRNYKHTPDSILAEMGSSAIIWLAVAGESVEHIGRLAAIVGKTVNDFLPVDMYVPPRAFIVHEDYSVTLADPQEGFDAWGRPIVEPAPE